jgi:hypothetical protein
MASNEPGRPTPLLVWRRGCRTGNTRSPCSTESPRMGYKVNSQARRRKGAAMIRKVGTFIAIVGLWMGSAVAADLPASGTVPVLIRPDCKQAFFLLDFIGLDGKVVKPARPDYVDWDPASAKPSVYRDPRTSITFYVESDGRHLAAIDGDGKLLWVRNPFEDRQLCPYRTGWPVISGMEATDISPALAKLRERWGVNTHDKFIAIPFDSSQFGVVNETTGDFDFEGQD